MGLTQIIPLLLLTLPAGHVAEQRERRGIIFWMQVMTAAATAGLTFVSWTHAAVPWTFLFLSLGGVARAFLWPASGAILPQLVPRAMFPTAVMWSSGSFQFSAALGPVVGGIVIARTGSATGVYAFNVFAALFCGVMISLVQARPAAPVKREKMTTANLAAGVKFVFRTPVILGTISLDLFAVLLGGAVALLPVYSRGKSCTFGAAGAGLVESGNCLSALHGDGDPPRAPAADGERGPFSAYGRSSGFGAGHGDFRPVALVLAVVGDALRPAVRAG